MLRVLLDIPLVVLILVCAQRVVVHTKELCRQVRELCRHAEKLYQQAKELRAENASRDRDKGSA